MMLCKQIFEDVFDEGGKFQTVFPVNFYPDEREKFHPGDAASNHMIKSVSHDQMLPCVVFIY